MPLFTRRTKRRDPPCQKSVCQWITFQFRLTSTQDPGESRLNPEEESPESQGSTMDTTATNEEDLPIVYTILEASVAVIAVVGNLLVMIVFIQDRRLRKVTNFYIISLSLADLLVGLIGIPSAILTKIGQPKNSTQLCLIMLSLLIVLCTISILNLVAVSLDRYWAILHPLDYHKRISEKTAFAIICACWILGSVIGFIPLFGWHNVPENGCYFIPTMDYDFLLFLYFFTIVFPAFIMAFFYIRIYIVVVQQLSLNKIRQSGETKFSKCKFKTRTSLADQSFGSNFNVDSEINEPKSPKPSTNRRDDDDTTEPSIREDVRDSRSNSNSGMYIKQQQYRSSLPHPLVESHSNQKYSTNPRSLNRFPVSGTNNHLNSQSNSVESFQATMVSSSKNTHRGDNKFARKINDTIWSHKNHRNDHEDNGNGSNSNKNDSNNNNNNAGKFSYSRREVKKAQKLFVIVVFFMICWIPLYTSNALHAICPDCPELSATCLNYLIILSHINSAGSPFLYAFQMKDFRQALHRLIFKGAINPRKLRDLRREELFSVSGCQRGTNMSKDFELSPGPRQNSGRFGHFFRTKHGHDHDSNNQYNHSSYHESIEHVVPEKGHVEEPPPPRSATQPIQTRIYMQNSPNKYFTLPMRNKYRSKCKTDHP